MDQKNKLIRSIYLYITILTSLIFMSIGTGILLNTGLKYYIFPKAEKGGYHRCNQQPPLYGVDIYSKIDSEDQKQLLENLLRDYEQWQKNNTGEECYNQDRQKEIVKALTMLIVSLPIFLFHWNIIRKEKNKI